MSHNLLTNQNMSKDNINIYQIIIIIVVLIILSYFSYKIYQKFIVKNTGGSSASSDGSSGSGGGGGSSGTDSSNSFIGCVSCNSSFNPLDLNLGVQTVENCNILAKNAGASYFGMSDWKSANGGVNNGTANCLISSHNLSLQDITSYQGPPGTSYTNAPSCPQEGPFTSSCISQDTNICTPNTHISGYLQGSLGGRYINAIYKTGITDIGSGINSSTNCNGTQCGYFQAPSFIPPIQISHIFRQTIPVNTTGSYYTTSNTCPPNWKKSNILTKGGLCMIDLSFSASSNSTDSQNIKFSLVIDDVAQTPLMFNIFTPKDRCNIRGQYLINNITRGSHSFAIYIDTNNTGYASVDENDRLDMRMIEYPSYWTDGDPPFVNISQVFNVVTADDSFNTGGRATDIGKWKGIIPSTGYSTGSTFYTDLYCTASVSGNWNGNTAGWSVGIDQSGDNGGVFYNDSRDALTIYQNNFNSYASYRWVNPWSDLLSTNVNYTGNFQTNVYAYTAQISPNDFLTMRTIVFSKDFVDNNLIITTPFSITAAINDNFTTRFKNQIPPRWNSRLTTNGGVLVIEMGVSCSVELENSSATFLLIIDGVAVEQLFFYFNKKTTERKISGYFTITNLKSGEHSIGVYVNDKYQYVGYYSVLDMTVFEYKTPIVNVVKY